ncbi:MAG: hypothetical protein H6672_16265 [Anaerolineaceae bacterium]|nr:hypothetical protein [Anaerolineaceae bacterium]
MHIATHITKNCTQEADLEGHTDFVIINTLALQFAGGAYVRNASAKYLFAYATGDMLYVLINTDFITIILHCDLTASAFYLNCAATPQQKRPPYNQDGLFKHYDSCSTAVLAQIGAIQMLPSLRIGVI